MAFWNRSLETGNEVGEVEQKTTAPESGIESKENADGKLDGGDNSENSCKNFRDSMKVEPYEMNNNQSDGRLESPNDTSSDFTGANNGIERSIPDDEGR